VPKRTKAEKVNRNRGMIAGLAEHFAGEKLVIDNKQRTVDEIVAVYEEHLRALADVQALTIQRSIAVQREGALEKRVARLTGLIKSLLRAVFGATSATLRGFGVEPDRTPTMSAETKRRANEKRQETRRKRAVMGKRQRKKVKAG
jgi:hypothetical protein